MNGAMPGVMPDNAAYFHAAYVVAAVLYAGYAIGLWVRARRVAARRRALGVAGAEPTDR